MKLYSQELSVRDSPAGGPVAGSIREGPNPWLGHAGRVILFVHGYNNTLGKARESYDAFSTGLAERVREAAAEILGPRYRFYWPGDADLWIFSFISYPVEIIGTRARPVRSATGAPGAPDGASPHHRGASYRSALTGPSFAPYPAATMRGRGVRTPIA